MGKQLTSQFEDTIYKDSVFQFFFECVRLYFSLISMSKSSLFAELLAYTYLQSSEDTFRPRLRLIESPFFDIHLFWSRDSGFIRWVQVGTAPHLKD
jgi:hypothetical protein